MPDVRDVALVLGTSTGGIGRHVHSLAAGLLERGYRVRVAGPAGTDALFGFAALGAAFHPVEIAAGPRPLADARAVARLAGAVRGAEVVHAHGLRAGLLASLPPAAGPPLVVTWHNAVLARGARGAVFRLLERRVARAATVTLGASSDLVERARLLGGRDVRLGPVAAPPLPPAVRTRDAVRRELDAGQHPVVLSVGRLHPQKDFATLVRAAAVLAGRDPQPLVVIAGDGPQRAQVGRLVEDAGAPVRLLGHRSDVADLLAAADVAVLTSVWEARALVAQEALRAGVPLVATRVGGIPELVGDAALLVPAADPDAVASAIATLLDDPELRGRLVADGRALAATWPTLEDTVGQVAAVYAELRRRG